MGKLLGQKNIFVLTSRITVILKSWPPSSETALFKQQLENHLWYLLLFAFKNEVDITVYTVIQVSKILSKPAK